MMKQQPPITATVPPQSLKLELKKIMVAMHKRTWQLLQIQHNLLIAPPQDYERLAQEREMTLGAIRLCQDIAADILNYWRYLPETALAFKHRLEVATKRRDEETEAMRSHRNKSKLPLVQLPRSSTLTVKVRTYSATWYKRRMKTKMKATQKRPLLLSLKTLNGYYWY